MSASVLTPWPPALVGTPSVAVIERAIARDRLSHSLLLTADDVETLSLVATAIADRLLNPAVGPGTNENAGTRGPARPYFAPDQHPDSFFLRPAGKMRQISADATRQLIGKVQVSPTLAPRKVAVIYECDRMNTTAANIFLK